MAFPLSAQGEIVLTAADGKLPSADIALGRLDAAISAQDPEDITRTPSSLSFQFNPLAIMWSRRIWIRSYYWDPNRLQVHRGSVVAEESADGLRFTYDLDYRGSTYFIVALIVLLILLRPTRELGVVALPVLLLLGWGLIASATSQFRYFIRHAVIGRIKLGPDDS